MGPRAAGESGHELALVDNAIDLELDLRCYRLSAIKKAAYRFADRFTAVLGSPAQDRIAISLRFKSTVTEVAAREATRMFFQELLDQELREQIAAETDPIRTLILAHAFSNLDLIKREP
ncbi:MAG: His-Xaa-Ser system protein HxsD [Deltaproteobacteria bacterium]|nr:MAG: His-Xaa-Ser system protein HxsD [Deltaproteobacteria bacterium]TMQ28383.1 MAG: His-Xaa-Ser system protein HxsD [Deltaproteobacteria bacterium]